MLDTVNVVLRVTEMKDIEKIVYSYTIDDYGTMIVFENDTVLCTISDVNKKNGREVFAEIVYEMRGIELDESKN